MTSRSKVSITLNGPAAREALSGFSSALLAIGVDKFSDALDELRGSTWPLVIEIKRRRPKRSHDQNALYWAWCKIIGDELGYEAEELHYAFRARFLDKVSGPFGLPVPESTTTLTRDEFNDYLGRVLRFAAEQGIALPQTTEEWERWDSKA